MTETIIVALISGGVTLAGTAISCILSVRKSAKDSEIRQAVTDEKIAELTREVREHNGFARRMPVVEEQIKVINHRIEDLERSDRK